jgi:glyoxylate reductase
MDACSLTICADILIDMKKDPKEVKILVSRQIPEKGIALLRDAGFTVTVWPLDRPMTPSELIEEAKKNTALICLSADKINKDFLNECRHLDIISQFAAGFDNIDIAEATRIGIPVGNAPDAMSDATADIAFGLMLAVSRKMFYMHKTIGKGEWKFFRPMGNLGMEMKKKTLGVFGLGRIGVEMAKRCKGAYEMDIIYHNRGRNETAEKELNAKRVSFDELLRQSDVLSVHSVLNEETRGIFNKAAFDKMKPTSIFINTSRGGVHDEKDLVDALNNGNIWGAGLDVTNPEPMKADNPLLDMENVAILPHIGSATIEARTEMSRQAAVNVLEFYKGNKIPNWLNPPQS